MTAALKWLAERLLFVAVGFACAWFIQEANQRADEIEDAYWSLPDTSTHQTPVVNVPPAVVNPNPAPSKPRPDLTDRRRIDSLIASNASKDSLIAAQGETQFTTQHFQARKDSVLVVGHMDILYFPMDHYFLTEAFVDSLSVPERVIEITRTIREVETDWGWTLAGVATGMVVGGLIFGGVR